MLRENASSHTAADQDSTEFEQLRIAEIREYRQELVAERDVADKELTRNAYDRGVAVVERLIIGGGWAAVTNYATLPQSLVDEENRHDLQFPSVLAIADAPDPWSIRKGYMGQSPGELTLFCASAQSEEYSSSSEQWATSYGFSQAIATTRAHIGFPCIRGKVASPIERQGANDHSWPAPLRVRTLYEGREMLIYAHSIDVAAGPGPSRRLGYYDSGIVIDPDELVSMERDGLVIYGDEQLALTDDLRGKQIVVLGGGASASWNAERAALLGASEVLWIAKPSVSPSRRTREGKILHDLEESLAQMEEGHNSSSLKRAKMLLVEEFNTPPFVTRASLLTDGHLSTKEIESRLGAFSKAYAPRNVDPLIPGALVDARIILESKFLQSSVLKRNDTSSLILELPDGSSHFAHQVIVSFGQDSSALGGAAHLVSVEARLLPLYVDGESVGLKSLDGRVRVIGAAAASPHLVKKLALEDAHEYMHKLQERAERLPLTARYSLQSVLTWKDAIILANRTMA